MKPYYERAGITIFNADCRDVLPTLAPGSVDLVLTDPPYGVEFRNQQWDKDVPEVALQLPYLYRRVAIIMGIVAAWQFPTPKWWLVGRALPLVVGARLAGSAIGVLSCFMAIAKCRLTSNPGTLSPMPIRLASGTHHQNQNA